MLTMQPYRAAAVFLLVAITGSARAADLLPPDRPIADIVDHYVDAKLKAAGVTPAPQADDSTVVRRLTLDLAGRIPTEAEARQFVASTDSQKRQQWIERLVASPWFDRHTATEFNTLLRGLDGSGPDMRKYLLVAVKENRPWNRIFRELLGDGSDPLNPNPLGPEQFTLKRAADADLLTRDVSSMFFGINVTCCQCHTHPYVATLTQDYFYGMKAFFSRTYEFQGQLLERRFAPAKLQFKDRGGENREVSMMFLSGESLPLPDPGVPDLTKAIAEESKEIEALKKDFAKNKVYPPAAEFSPRGQLLKIVEKPENQAMMARTLVNRLWFRLFGHGLVMRVDQMHSENPGSHPELLEWLARDLIAHQWDMRRTVSGLVASRAYSRSSRWTGPIPAKELFAVAELRPLTPMQFGMSVLVAGDSTFDTAAPADLERKIGDLESRAQGFVGTLLEQPLLEGFQINVREPLAISNDPARLKAIGAAIVPNLLKLTDTQQQIDSATWAVLSRVPSPSESDILANYVDSQSKLSVEDRARIEQTIADHKQKAEAARARIAEIDAALAAADARGALVPVSTPGWKYIAAAQNADETWLRGDFDDAAWKTAKSPIGFGNKLIDEKKGDLLEVKGGDVAFRRVFNIDAAQLLLVKKLRLQVASDDSAAVYLNGKLIDDEKANHDAVYWNRTVEIPADALIPGRNLIAVRLRNAEKSSDGFFDLQLSSDRDEDRQQREALAKELKDFQSVASAPPPTLPSDTDLRRKAIENMVWALVAGSEFRFN
jgi:hypothetical protein